MAFLVLYVLGLCSLGVGKCELDDLVVEEDEEVSDVDLGRVDIEGKRVKLVEVVADEVKHLLNEALVESQVHHLILLSKECLLGFDDASYFREHEHSLLYDRHHLL
jgi:hypothetical protein